MVIGLSQRLCQTACNKGRDECLRLLRDETNSFICQKGCAICMRSCSEIITNTEFPRMINQLVQENQNRNAPFVGVGIGFIVASGGACLLNYNCREFIRTLAPFVATILLFTLSFLWYYKRSSGKLSCTKKESMQK